MFADSCASWEFKCAYCRPFADELDWLVEGRDCVEVRGDAVERELVDMLGI